jgi:hypothetical protein
MHACIYGRRLQSPLEQGLIPWALHSLHPLLQWIQGGDLNTTDAVETVSVPNGVVAHSRGACVLAPVGTEAVSRECIPSVSCIP